MGSLRTVMQCMFLGSFVLLTLAGCNPEPEAATTQPATSSETPLPATATIPPTTTAIPATAVASVEPTTAPEEVEPEPTTPAGEAAAVLPAAPLPVNEELTLALVQQLGGLFSVVALDGETAFLGIGPRFTTVNVSDPASPQLLWQSDPLADVVGAIAVVGGRAYLRVGANLLVYDVSDPAAPALMGEMSGISGNLYPVGDFVYATGETLPGIAPQSLLAIDVIDPTQITLADSRELTGATGIAATEEAVFLAGGGEYDDSNDFALRLVDPADLGSTLSETPLSADWGHRVAVAESVAYVVENRHDGGPDTLLVLDAGGPRQPVEIASLQFDIEMTIQKVLAVDEALFILARSFPHTGCPSYLYVVDIAEPAAPQGPVEFDPGSCFNDFTVAGDILAATSERGLQLFDVSDPANPTLSGELAPPDGVIAVERVGVNDDLLYLQTTAGRSRSHRLRVLDLATAPPTWLNGEGLELAIEPSIFEGLDIRGNHAFGLVGEPVDVSDPANPQLVVPNPEGVFYWPTPALAGQYLYTGLLSETPDGMWMGGGIGIVDAGDPANPQLAGMIPMEDATVVALAVDEPYLLVLSRKVYSETPEATLFETSLHVFDISNPLVPVEVSRLEPAVPAPEEVWDIALAGDTLYAAGVLYGGSADNEYNLHVLDLSDPLRPAPIGRFELPANVTKMAAAGDRLYMRLGGELWVLDISDRANPFVAGRFLEAIDFAVAGSLMYTAAGDAGLFVYEVAGE